MDAATRRSMLRNALLLGLFALVGVGLVALVQQFTEARIAEAQREARGRALLELLPPGSYDNHPLDSQVPTFAPKLLGLDAPRPAYVARLHGQASAVILQASAPDGYSGAIQLLVGVTAQGRLLACGSSRTRKPPASATASNWPRVPGCTVSTARAWAIRRTPAGR